MKVYVTVYRTENVTRTAELLNLTQPVVTRTIQEVDNASFLRENQLVRHRCKFLTPTAGELMELLRKRSFPVSLPSAGFSAP